MNNMYNTINRNLGYMSRFLMNKAIDKVVNLIPLFNFDENNTTLVAANNNFSISLNKENFSEFGINSWRDIQNKDIVYMLYNRSGFYVGQTTDFYERMHTHIKDVVDGESVIYQSIRENKDTFVTILHIFDHSDENYIKGIERTYLDEIIPWKINQNMSPYILNMKR